MRGKPIKADAFGVCRLTGNPGKFVKSHIIPKALTPKEDPGGPLVEADGKKRPKRQWDSWYDPSLVIRKGEDHLAEIDSSALRILSEHKLIWKSWRDQDELGIDHIANDEEALLGIRLLEGVDQTALGVFAVSLLWRAGSSDLPAMHEFNVPNDILESARLVTLGKREFEPNEFPVKMFQYATKGPMHNLTPMNLERPLATEKPEPFFRIFANGVFFHIVDTTARSNFDVGKAKWFLGNSDELAVLCFDFEKSTQARFFENTLDHYHALMRRQ
ncbi:hypothetical protein [Aliiroseovarius subalbicans]|uniref:hypothetical protein n=1 Tax=Aliiroseovarius subalbicans TaxID=2925840 RepID=UPI001F583652|nr:hypothetical protein [Aliiroseovarius subalbicans]MCI2399402.1 hypothetical protein [Aliiroseovarius subalbicans]